MTGTNTYWIVAVTLENLTVTWLDWAGAVWMINEQFLGRLGWLLLESVFFDNTVQSRLVLVMIFHANSIDWYIHMFLYAMLVELLCFPYYLFKYVTAFHSIHVNGTRLTQWCKTNILMPSNSLESAITQCFKLLHFLQLKLNKMVLIARLAFLFAIPLKNRWK